MATPNLGMILPVPTVTLGPQWATELNAALTVIDNHDHTSAKGLRIVTAALNIDDDLTMNFHRLVDTEGLTLQPLGSPLSGAGNEATVNNSGGDLYWTNGSGVPVQITAGGSVITVPASVQAYQYDEVSSDLIIGAGDVTVVVAMDSTGGPRSVTLPLAAAVATGRIYMVVDLAGTSEANPISLLAAGADLIAGEASQVLESNYGSLFVISNGVDAWRII